MPEFVRKVDIGALGYYGKVVVTGI